MSFSPTLDRTPVESPPESPTGRPGYGSIVTGMLLLVGGVLWLLDVLEVIDVQFTLVLPVLLGVIGVALILGASRGPQVGLIVAGVFVALATLAVAVTPEGAFSGGIGERNITVTNQADLATRYDVGVGQIRLDLSEMAMTESAEVTVSVGAGEIRIILPDGVPVTVNASAGAGEINVLGQQASGLSRTLEYTSSGFDTATVTLTLNLSVAAGNIEVTR